MKCHTDRGQEINSEYNYYSLQYSEKSYKKPRHTTIPDTKYNTRT